MKGYHPENGYRTVQSIVYERILHGKSYDDVMEQVPSYKQKKEILEKIERYRTIESRDMSAQHRAKVTGLKKSTCSEFNKVYTQCKCA